MKKELLSFHGKQEIKDAHIAQLQRHYDADEIIQGKYWENGKGCDTGCSFHSNDHNQWPLQLGVPIIIGKLRDQIFEGLPNAEAKKFPLACSNATPVGVDIDNVWRKFMIWLLIDDTEGVVKFAKTDAERKALRDVADAFTESLTTEVSFDRWTKLRAAAANAANAAYANAAYAAANAAAAAANAAAAKAANANAAYAAANAAAAAAKAAAANAAYAAANAYAAAKAAAANAANAAAAAANAAAAKAAAANAYAAAKAAAANAANAANAAYAAYAAAAANANAAAAAANANAAAANAYAAANAAAAAAAANAAYAANAAAAAARHGRYIKMSEKLIELLKEAA